MLSTEGINNSPATIGDAITENVDCMESNALELYARGACAVGEPNAVVTHSRNSICADDHNYAACDDNFNFNNLPDRCFALPANTSSCANSINAFAKIVPNSLFLTTLYLYLMCLVM